MSRETTIQIRVSLEEKDRIKAQADHLRVPVSDFVRSCALREHLGSPIPYETEHEKANKAKVRKAVENEEPYEVKIEPGTAQPNVMREDEEETWISRRTNQLKVRMSSRAARRQAEIEWEEMG